MKTGRTTEILSADRKPLVLIIDDQYRALQSLTRLISPEKFETLWTPSEKQGLKILNDRSNRVRVVVLDLKSSTMGAGGFFHQTRHKTPGAAFLITGPLGTILHQDGEFYEFSGASLRDNINHILASIIHQRKDGNRAAGERSDLPDRTKERLGPIIGRSGAINEIFGLIDKLRNVSSTVLIQGESGVGKELIAQTLHRTSRRKGGPFVAINCGAIPANLMESELFGHERGAFTSANAMRKGKFEIARGGTIFLDEVSEIDRGLQVKLLRILQEREFERVGGNEVRKSDVRVIAATGRNLRGKVQAGHFRDDLFFRLNVIPVHVPPLRERRTDIPLLIEHFLKENSQRMGLLPPTLTEKAETALLGYSYPGNVRELANTMERLCILCSGGKAAFADLPREIRAETETPGPPDDDPSCIADIPAGGVRLQEVEKELILKTLQKTAGNKTAAARMMGITRRRLYLRLSEYGIAGA
jgi:DNA-binding NtrC family response regulator